MTSKVDNTIFLCPKKGTTILQLREAQRKFGDHILTLKSCCCHGQLAPFRVATCRLTSFGGLSCLTVGDAQLLRFGNHSKRGRLPVTTPLFYGQTL